MRTATGPATIECRKPRRVNIVVTIITGTNAVKMIGNVNVKVNKPNPIPPPMPPTSRDTAASNTVVGAAKMPSFCLS